RWPMADGRWPMADGRAPCPNPSLGPQSRVKQSNHHDKLPNGARRPNGRNGQSAIIDDAPPSGRATSA
ncbi:MAG: hypothetical protein OXU70_17660, partial [Gammaproteobacteria bacterium]|nr:hypothetical protein [Gammaproteobacteria bacterium]